MQKTVNETTGKATTTTKIGETTTSFNHDSSLENSNKLSKRVFDPNSPSRYAGKPGSVRSSSMNFKNDERVFSTQDIPERVLEKKIETLELKMRNRENRKPEWNSSTFTTHASEERALLRTLAKEDYLIKMEQRERKRKEQPPDWKMSTFFTEKEKETKGDEKLSKSLRNTKKVVSEISNAPSLIEREKMRQEEEKRQREEATRVTMREHFLNSPPITLGLSRRLFGEQSNTQSNTVIVKDIIDHVQ
ncbi:hypothetical protein FDP41_006535 [Naegleria fowleri]|uniref:Uncharacterized protein n=1 Tax=Naegleria fowleri TaxID=5763 RepID=A0A6A5B849_NAEFO|nr:uncharacterized protein FDP41_006535 [Naegleria fowleri]KAF0974503.1 hypothetical protein FDP41_006535 [Naegleria fowleri]CAG4716996.1 unnamed protein product [Naegleria fowleri]